LTLNVPKRANQLLPEPIIPASLPLSQQIAISTADFDEMEAFLDKGNLLEKRSLNPLNRERKLNGHISSAKLNKIQFMGVHLGTDVIAKSVPLEVAQLVIPVSGQLVNRSPNKCEQVIPIGSAVFHTPNHPVEVKWESESSAIVVRIPKHYFQKIYRSYAGKDFAQDFSLGSYLDLTQNSGQSLFSIVHNMVREMESDSLFSKDNRQMELWEELLVTTLFACQGQIDSSILQIRGSKPVYHYVKKATDYIMENLDECISLDELIKVSGVSIRTLQTGFKKSLGIGPMTFIREQKLKQVHKELMYSSPVETKVGDIAAKWGFYHASYFTKQYKHYFSELPSETLLKHNQSIYISR
jgi:AraC-like DNA-binding protein